MPVTTWRQFIRLESSGGIILLIAALLAIVINNSPLHAYYKDFLNFHMGAKSLLWWINDGLMTLFFLLVGLEIKRELLVGELNSVKKATLPVFAAIGGMLVPAIIFLLFNLHNTVVLRGWAIPTATDIAFSLGILALLGSRIPMALKVLLTALAIIDDMGAIIIIAAFYTETINWFYLGGAIAFTIILILLNRFNVTRIAAYLLLGFFMWGCVLNSGVHPTLAGIILALIIPLKVKEGFSPLKKLEKTLHPWVIFGIIPLFAFANAGVDLSGISWSTVSDTLALGIAFGLFFGKQLGIWLLSLLAIRLKWAHKPKNTDFGGLYGMALLGGIGFTMSLFIGSLAFGQYDPHYLERVRVGVIAGSLLSGIIGYTVLRFRYPRILKLEK